MGIGEGKIKNQGGVQIPQHVAIIMDGNGRWAEKRNLPRHAGHRAGVGSVRVAVEECAKYGVEVLTLFAFSSENWNRPKKEVGLLLELFMTALQRDVMRLKKNNICLRVIGDRFAFPEKLQRCIQDAEVNTAENTGLILQIAANYGGRWDITQAAKKLAQKVKANELDPDDITEADLARELSFAGLPDPDLFIRTGGEQRISNFILWQSAYSELYFCDRLWPDFDASAFEQALMTFAQRERRFGQTSEQVGVIKPAAAEQV